jgi:hypothetical protein
MAHLEPPSLLEWITNVEKVNPRDHHQCVKYCAGKLRIPSLSRNIFEAELVKADSPKDNIGGLTPQPSYRKIRINSNLVVSNIFLLKSILSLATFQLSVINQ